MEKQNKLLLLLKSLPVAVIFMFWFLKPNSFIYAQIPSSTAIPTSSPKMNTSLSQASSSTELRNIWEYMSPLGTLLSGLAAIFSLIFTFIGLVKSGNNEKEVKTNQLMQIQLEKLVKTDFYKVIDAIIKQTDDPIKKNSLLELKEELEKERRVLAKRVGISKEAETWLKKHREQLAYDAINNALINESVPKDVRDKFLSQIEDYLHAIYTSLNIGDTEYLEELVNELVSKHVLTNSLYKKALEFVSNKAANSKNLSPFAFEEMKYYLDYLMSSIP